MPLRLVACLAVLACAAPAFAQAPGQTAPLAPAPPPPAPRNPSVALGLSLGITLGGAALLLGGASTHDGTVATLGVGVMYFGPSTGHWYASEVGGIGLGLRALAVVGAGVALVRAYGDAECEGDEGPCPDDSTLITGLLVASATAWLGSTIYDIATAPRATRSWNRDHGVTFGPTAMRSAAGRSVPGVAFGLRF